MCVYASVTSKECATVHQEMLTPLAFLTADFETPLLQITVPRKIETNTKDGKEPEAHVIKKLILF
jgi:hypothetical protein